MGLPLASLTKEGDVTAIETEKTGPINLKKGGPPKEIA